MVGSFAASYSSCFIDARCGVKYTPCYSPMIRSRGCGAELFWAELPLLFRQQSRKRALTVRVCAAKRQFASGDTVDVGNSQPHRDVPMRKLDDPAAGLLLGKTNGSSSPVALERRLERVSAVQTLPGESVVGNTLSA